MANDMVTLVPPRRLGSLLTSARQDAGLDLGDLAGRSRFDAEELGAIEAGDRPLTDAEVAEVLSLYRVDGGALVPERAELVIDLDEHRLSAGGELRTLVGGAPAADEVLASYLSLVYTLRSAVPGTALTLRDGDVDVLSRALHLAQPEVERRLHRLMIEPEGAVSDGVHSLRLRLLIPVAGIIVAVTAVGTLLFVQANDDPAPTTSPAPTEIPVDIGTAVIQTRLPDGSPGPVVPVAPPADLVPETSTSTSTVAASTPDVESDPTPPTSESSAPVPGPAQVVSAQVGPAQTLEAGPDGITVIYAEGPIDLLPGQVQLGEAQTITPDDLVGVGQSVAIESSTS